MFFKKEKSSEKSIDIKKYQLEKGWCESFYLSCIHQNYFELEILKTIITMHDSAWEIPIKVFGVVTKGVDVLMPFVINLYNLDDPNNEHYFSKNYKIENEEKKTIGDCSYFGVSGDDEPFFESKEIFDKIQESYKSHPNLIIPNLYSSSHTYIVFEINLLMKEQNINYIMNNINNNLSNSESISILKKKKKNCYEIKRDENHSTISPYEKIEINFNDLKTKKNWNFRRQIIGYEYITTTSRLQN